MPEELTQALLALEEVKVYEAEASTGFGVEYECSWEVAVVSAGGEESADGFSLKFVELRFGDVRRSERIPDAGEVVYLIGQESFAWSNRIAQDRYCMGCALAFETFEFAGLESVGRFHDTKSAVWCGAVFLVDLGGLGCVALI